MFVRKVIIGVVAVTAFAFAVSAYADSQPSEAEIRNILIRESIASYPGNCPCPYNTDKAGRKCGKRSAYSKPGGYAPLCYPDDVTQEMIQEYRDGKEASVSGAQ